MKTPERVIVDQLALDVLQSANFSSKQNAVAAQILGARPADVWRANEDGYVSPALLRAMAAAGYLDPHEVAAVLTVPVPPCAECGEAHLQKTCAYNRKRRYPPTLKIRTDDVESAAASIMRSYPRKHSLLALLSFMWELEEERQRLGLAEAATEE